jgi:predicted phage baseplate assembly protein
VLAYQPPGVGPGLLILALESLGTGDGRPWQQVSLAWPRVAGDSLQLFTEEDGRWQRWEERADFDASGRRDAHYVLEPTLGNVRFGDGEHGRVMAAGVPILAAYDSTQAEEGKLRVGVALSLFPSTHNRALLKDWQGVSGQLASVRTLLAAAEGAAAETVMQAAGRALQAFDRPQRAVTLADYEALALATPGVQLARVAARPNLHPGFPCFQAPGVVAVILLPYLPSDKPAPGPALRQRVARYLAQRRVIGTRIEVIGPIYRTIAARTTVRACQGVNANVLQARMVERLNEFFHPLRGGPEETGWPFGRDVYRSEVLQVLDETPGVEYVLALELLADGCDPQCANVCLGPLGLVAAGKHEIAVVGWQEVWQKAQQEVQHGC